LEKNYTLFLGHGSSALDLTSNFNTDNMYLSILYEFGVLGVVVFIYLLYLFLKKNDAIFKTLGSTSAYFRKNASICFVFFSANLFNFLTSQSIVSNGGMLLFLLIIGYQRGLLCTAKKLYFQTTFKNYQTSLAR
jgi:O-antigen ligase